MHNVPVLTLVLFAVSMFLLSPPAQVAGQRMSEEVVALHRAAFEFGSDETLGDTAVYRELALRYLDGRGVERDVIQGCALLGRADSAARSPRHDQPAIDVAEALLDQHCRALSKDEHQEVGYVLGCGFIGLKPQTFPLEPGSWVELNRLGYAVDRPSGRVEHRQVGDLTCQRQVVLLRLVPLSTSTGIDARTPYLIEMIAWSGGRTPAGLRRTLDWLLMQVVDSRIEHKAFSQLVTEAGSLWPPPEAPEQFRNGASFRMQGADAVRWGFGDDPDHTGVFELGPKAPARRRHSGRSDNLTAGSVQRVRNHFVVRHAARFSDREL